MSNNNDAQSPDTAPVEPAAQEGSVASDRRVSRGWLIAAVAAGGALLLALAFGGGVATGLGVGAITRGGFAADQGSLPTGPGHGGPHRWGDGAGPGQGGPDGGVRRDRQDDADTPTPTPSPSSTPTT